MKKAFSVFLILLLIAVCGSVYAAARLDQAGDQVSFEEKILYGDRAAADGIRVKSYHAFRDMLFWESGLTFGKESFQAATKVFYEPDNKMRDKTGWQYDTDILYLWSDQEIYSDFGDNGQIVYHTLPPIEKDLNEAIDKVQNGQELHFRIKLSDYFDYYPLVVDMNTPEGYFSTNTRFEEIPELAAIYEEVRSYFRIPILEEETWEYLISKTEDGQLDVFQIGDSVNESDAFTPSCYSVRSGDDFYFTFLTKTHKGNHVDVSQIPVGYGIYKIPIAKGDLSFQDGRTSVEDLVRPDVAATSLFYDLDPKADIRGLDVSLDGKKLFLITMEEGSFHTKVLDTETGALLSEIAFEYKPQTEEEIALYPQRLYRNETTYAYLLGDSVQILSEEADGSFVYKLRSEATDFETYYDREASTDYEPMELFGFSLTNNYTRAGTKFAYDGKRFAILLDRWNSDRDHWSYLDCENCGFTLVIYDENGLAYVGEYISSLDQANPHMETPYEDSIKNIGQYAENEICFE